ncbi:Uncharacterised protein [Chlamydia abortus]|nr:Uncharacterised protein [Chlamydia abortus]
MLSGVRAEQQTSFLNCTATSRSDLHAIWPSLNSFLPPSGCSSLFLGFSGDFALPSLAFWNLGKGTEVHGYVEEKLSCCGWEVMQRRPPEQAPQRQLASPEAAA